MCLFARWLFQHVAQRSAVCVVGAESRWRVFLHSWCDVGLWLLLVYSRVGKNRDTRRESPAVAGAGRGASHGTASLVTRLSRHGAPMTYTGLLGIVAVLFLFIQNREELTRVQMNRFPFLLGKPLRIRWSVVLLLSWGVSPVVLD